MSNLRLFVVALLTATVLLGQKYDVHLTPRNRAGDLFLYSGKGTSLRQASVAGQVVNQEEISAEIEAKGEVLSVDASGEPVRVALTVTRFSKLEAGAKSDLVEPGSVVLVDAGAEVPVSLKGGNLSDDARKAMEVVYARHKPGAATDDDIFGVKEPKAVGESWPIHAKLAAEDLKKSGIEVAPEHLAGRTELLGKDKLDDADCLNVRAEFTGSGVAIQALPAGNEGSVQAVVEGCVPISSGSYRKGMEMTFKLHFTANDSTIDVLAKQKSSATWREVRK